MSQKPGRAILEACAVRVLEKSCVLEAMEFGLDVNAIMIMCVNKVKAVAHSQLDE